MKVWLAPSSFAPHRGGVEEVTMQLARGLQQIGHSVLVVANRHPPELPDAQTIDGVEIRRIVWPAPRAAPTALAIYLRERRKAISALDKFQRPDLVHAHCVSSQIAIFRDYCRSKRIPMVLTTHGETVGDANRIYEHSVWLRHQFRRAAAEASAITGPSAWVLQQASRLAPRLAGGEVIPNGIEADYWAGPPLDPTGQGVFAWGRHVPEKGLDLLLDAWTRVEAEEPAATLSIGGDGPMRAELSRKSLGRERIRFLGALSRDQVRQHLWESKVAAVPSRIEAFGMTALESLAAGRLLVHSGRGGLAGVVAGRGIAANPEDPEAFGGAIVDAIRMQRLPYDPSSLRRYEWAEVTTAYLDIYSRSVRQ